MVKFFLFMKFKLVITLFLILSFYANAQTKVSGIVIDDKNQPVPYANIMFKGTNEGVVSNEDGRFYLESKLPHKVIVVSFSGFQTKEVTLPKEVNYDFKIKITDGVKLNEVVIYSGKTSKKNNPAIDILKKIWEHRRKNGLRQFNQYEMEKYEKLEFDMNTIDSAFMKSKIFKGMEFIFKQVDTSKVTGKTYLPIFINEALSNVYGDNVRGKVKEILKANKNSGFNTNQQIIEFVKDLYNENDIYNNYLNFFDKSFTSPLSKTGIDVYNYVLRDSSFIDKKWCYNILFYPRRKNELTFKGDFWVTDSTYAIKNITMASTKSANINWVKDIYLEQEFEVMNDSVFLLTRDYMMTDFALSKKETSRGMYGKRTTLYRNHKFNISKPADFYKEETFDKEESIFTKPDEFWEENRFENLNKDEKGIYKMLDTLQTNRKFKQLYNVVTILGSGYYNDGIIDYGPVLSTVGFNNVEGMRLRIGGRTYFGNNDLWRIQAYTAYGFKDNKVKYGVSGKWLLNRNNRLIIEGGTRRDVEQIGASLTTSNDVLGRSFASSSLFAGGNNGKLTNVNFTSFAVYLEPVKNLTLQTGFSFRTLVSASPEFKLDYYSTLPDALGNGGITRADLKQSEVNFQIDYTPGRKPIGYAVERQIVSSPYPRFFINFSQGIKGFLSSDFDYKKVQLYYKQPIIIGPLGVLNSTIELGKTYGGVPLGLMSIIPGNQTYFTIRNTFNLLNFYEFEADQYATLQLEHNFGGRIFSRIPYFRKLNWRETIGIRGAYGTISDDSRALNASGINYRAPENVYWEYNAGIGNIFKVFKIEFSWRGSYITPQTNNFGIKGSFGIFF